jgi:hypothetical protein
MAFVPGFGVTSCGCPLKDSFQELFFLARNEDALVVIPQTNTWQTLQFNNNYNHNDITQRRF